MQWLGLLLQGKRFKVLQRPLLYGAFMFSLCLHGSPPPVQRHARLINFGTLLGVIYLHAACN